MISNIKQKLEIILNLWTFCNLEQKIESISFEITCEQNTLEYGD